MKWHAYIVLCDGSYILIVIDTWSLSVDGRNIIDNNSTYNSLSFEKSNEISTKWFLVV